MIMKTYGFIFTKIMFKYEEFKNKAFDRNKQKRIKIKHLCNFSPPLAQSALQGTSFYNADHTVFGLVHPRGEGQNYWDKLNIHYGWRVMPYLAGNVHSILSR